MMDGASKGIFIFKSHLSPLTKSIGAVSQKAKGTSKWTGVPWARFTVVKRPGSFCTEGKDGNESQGQEGKEARKDMWRKKGKEGGERGEETGEEK